MRAVGVEDGSQAGLDIHDFEMAFEHAVLLFDDAFGVEFDVFEGGGFGDLVIMRADDEADVDGVGHGDDDGTDRPERGAVLRYVHGEDVALADEFEEGGGADGGGDFGRRAVVEAAVLHGGQADAVDDGVDVGGVGLEGLADHPARLAVFVAVGEESDGGGACEITGYFFPDEVESVALVPDIFAAAGELVLSGRVIVSGRAWHAGFANVGLVFEDADGFGASQADGEDQGGDGKPCFHVLLLVQCNSSDLRIRIITANTCGNKGIMRLYLTAATAFSSGCSLNSTG